MSDSVTYEEDTGCAPRPLPSLAEGEEESLVEEEPPRAAGATAGIGAGGGSNVSSGRRRASSSSSSCLAACNSDSFTRDERLRIGFRGGCLSRSRWASLVQFCESVGCEIILSINAMRGRRRVPCPKVECRNTKPAPPCCTNYTGGWDASNAKSLLRHVMQHNQPLAAVAYGNELGGHLAIGAKLRADVYAAGLKELRRLVEETWSSVAVARQRANKDHMKWRTITSAKRRQAPKVLGPNAQIDNEWIQELLSADERLDTVSHHLYSLGAGSREPSELISKILRPDFLDKLKAAATNAKSLLASSSRELWVTEMGGAYNSGRPGVTDAFVSAFWYADALGILASHSTKVVCRQTLLGGNYGLVALGRGFQSSSSNATTARMVEPDLPPRRILPDYYVLMLWRRLMGSTTLQVHLLHAATSHTTPLVTGVTVEGIDGFRSSGSSGSSSSSGLPAVRVYASCAASGASAPSGAITLLIINLHRAHVEVDLSALLLSQHDLVQQESGACARNAPLVATPAYLTTTINDTTTHGTSDDESGGVAGGIWDECALRCGSLPECEAFRLSTRLDRVDDGGRNCTLHTTPTTTATAAAADEPSSHGACYVRARSREASVAALAVRREWRLTASSLTSNEVLLNGSPLRAEADGVAGSLPELTPVKVDARRDVEGGAAAREAAALAYLAEGHSVSFVVLPEARWSMCV